MDKNLLPPHRLVLSGSLQGRYVLNRKQNVRLFVVQGSLKNRFGSQALLRWVQVKGLAYPNAQRKRLLAVSYSYAGNVLTTGQLRNWPVRRIMAHHKRRKPLAASQPQAELPFQLVFRSAKNAHLHRHCPGGCLSP